MISTAQYASELYDVNDFLNFDQKAIPSPIRECSQEATQPVQEASPPSKRPERDFKALQKDGDPLSTLKQSLELGFVQ